MLSLPRKQEREEKINEDRGYHGARWNAEILDGVENWSALLHVLLKLFGDVVWKMTCDETAGLEVICNVVRKVVCDVAWKIFGDVGETISEIHDQINPSLGLGLISNGKSKNQNDR